MGLIWLLVTCMVSSRSKTLNRGRGPVFKFFMALQLLSSQQGAGLTYA
jgi:hypothetical protein